MVPLPDTTHWLLKESACKQRHWSFSTRFVFASLVALVAIFFYAGLGISRYFALQTETSHAIAGANSLTKTKKAPDITGLWILQNGLDEQFSIRRTRESLENLEIQPLNGPPNLKWAVEWVPDRKQFVGTAVLPGEIRGTLGLSMAPGVRSTQLDVTLTFDELQNRRLLKRLSEDGVETPAARAEVDRDVGPPSPSDLGAA